MKRPSPVAIVMLVYIPFETGYFRESLDVLKLSLRSLYKNTDPPYDLLIFDNGSNNAVVNFLRAEQQAGRIQYLVLSETNVGKMAALNFMFGAAPGEYIAYSDSDIFFFPGWLDAHLKIAEAFPQVGLVNGLPARHLTSWATESTLSIAEKNSDIQIERGHLIPSEITVNLCEGVGRSLEEYTRENENGEDIRLTCRGVQAYVGAHHFQFVTRKCVLQELVPFRVTAPLIHRDDREFDTALDKAGYMRLTTTSQYTHHLGNVLTPKWRQIAEEYEVETRHGDSGSAVVNERLKRRISENRVVKRGLLKLYGSIFNLYYGDRKPQA